MKYYKGFDNQMRCKDFQYEEGKTYTHEGTPKLCSEGFHACEDALDCLSYYEPSCSEYHEVELEGVSPERKGDSKVVAKTIKIGAKLSIKDIVNASLEYRFSKCSKEEGSETNKERGSVSATGDSGAASATGYRGAASATGYRGAASATGDSGAASATGDRGAASATGYRGAASATGYRGAALINGNEGTAEVSGKESIAIAAGKDCAAKGALNTWLVLTERGEWNGETYPIIEVRAVKVDGETIKADTFYKLEGGKVKEA